MVRGSLPLLSEASGTPPPLRQRRDGVVRSNGPPIIGILKYYYYARVGSFYIGFGDMAPAETPTQAVGLVFKLPKSTQGYSETI